MNVNPSGEQIQLNRGAFRAIVVEVGGGLRALTVDEHLILDGYGPDEMCSGGRGQLLLPWPNRISSGLYAFACESYQLALSEPAKANAIHGLTRWANWTVGNRSGSEVVMMYRLHPSPGYPFALDLEAHYALGDRGLSLSIRATNIGDRACPFGAGAHPYVASGGGKIDSCALHLPTDSYLVADERSIPSGVAPVQGTIMDFTSSRLIGDKRLDVCYGALAPSSDGKARVRIDRPDDISIEVWMDAAHKFVMVFTGDTVHPESRRRDGLAIEPMTCAPNAFNTGDGLSVLQPGDSFTASWGIEIRGMPG